MWTKIDVQQLCDTLESMDFQYARYSCLLVLLALPHHDSDSFLAVPIIVPCTWVDHDCNILIDTWSFYPKMLFSLCWNHIAENKSIEHRSWTEICRNVQVCVRCPAMNSDTFFSSFICHNLIIRDIFVIQKTKWMVYR